MAFLAKQFNSFALDISDPCLRIAKLKRQGDNFELACFGEQGFDAFSMGSRILHVDTAVVALLAQLQLLYDMRSG